MSFLVLVLLALNCSTVLIEAPPKKNITLLAETSPAEYGTSMRCWYLFWGFLPISNNSTADIIAARDLKSVRVQTYFGIIDWIVTGLTGGILTTHSAYIEGNPQ